MKFSKFLLKNDLRRIFYISKNNYCDKATELGIFLVLFAPDHSQILIESKSPKNRE